MSSKKNLQREVISALWRKTRLSMDLSQLEFAKLLSVSGSYISEIEGGRKKPSPQLSKLFGLVTKDVSDVIRDSMPSIEDHARIPFQQLEFILENGTDTDIEAVLGKISLVHHQVKRTQKKEDQDPGLK